MMKHVTMAALALATATAALAEYPEKPITVIVPFSAGGPTDKVARDLAEALRKPLGGTIGAGQYYLIALAGGATGAPLPAANINGDINMSATTGKVALVNDFDPLEGTCPLGDVNIVDFVGYGTGATCAETANAPAPSNTSAIFRKNGGTTDNDNNQDDFVAAAPNPRRDAPIVEIGPAVFRSDPRTGNQRDRRDVARSTRCRAWQH